MEGSMKIDFTKIEVQVSFDGTRKKFNIAKEVGYAYAKQQEIESGRT